MTYKNYQNLISLLPTLEIEELDEIQKYIDQIKDDPNSESNFIFYETVSELRNNVVFDWKAHSQNEKCSYAEYLNLVLLKYEIQKSRNEDSFQQLEWALKGLTDQHINLLKLEDDNPAKIQLIDLFNSTGSASESLYDVLQETKQRVSENSTMILNYIKDQLESEKIKAFQTTKPEELPEPLSASQKEKVGLLIRTGIVDFLNEKYNANPNQIAEFFALITTDRLKAANTNPHFSTNNKHYSIQNSSDITDLDLKIKAIFKKAIL